MAGLAAGDLLLAIDGLRVTPATLEKQLARHRLGDTITVHAFRRDELMKFTVCLDAPEANTAKLAVTVKADRLRRDWLGS